MGKDLKGKELGVGISQRKDEIYQARYNDRWGRRKTIYNKDISELRRQLAEAVTDNERFTSIRDNVTLDTWFKNWMAIYRRTKVDPYFSPCTKVNSNLIKDNDDLKLIREKLQKVSRYS